MILDDLTDSKGTVIIPARTRITDTLAKKISSTSKKKIKILPYVSDQIEHMTADKEEHFSIAQANAILNEINEFTEDKIEAGNGVIDKLKCSFDAHTEEIYSKLYLNNHYKKVVKNLKRFSQYRKFMDPYPWFRVGLVMMRNNLFHLKEYCDFDINKVKENASSINGDLEFIETSCRSGKGVNDWLLWLDRQIKNKKSF